MATTNSILDLVRSVKINCTCAGDSFEGTGFLCWQSRDSVSLRSCVDSFGVPKLKSVSISLRSCVDFARSSLEFGSDLENLYRGREL